MTGARTARWHSSARVPECASGELELLSVPHGGKGAAVRAGMLSARGDMIVFADADMATPPDELVPLVAALEAADAAYGSRIQSDGSDMRKSQPAWRRALGRTFHLLASIWVVGPIQDTQCGFKGFRGRRPGTSSRASWLPASCSTLRSSTWSGGAATVTRWCRSAGGTAAAPECALDPAWPFAWRGTCSGSRCSTGTSGASSGRRPISRPADPRAAGIGAALARLLPVIAVTVFVLASAVTLAAAGSTLGYDFLAYHAAGARVLDGLAPYDTSFEAAGGFGLFYYPPTFLLLAIPFGLLPAAAATWLWIGLLLAAFGAGVAVMPVAARTRWLIVLLAGLSWPFLYNVKLGQVGPLLFLLFAVGWRNLDRPVILGLTGAIGAAIKVQPGLVLAWALLTRRWLAVVAGGVALVVITVAATLLAGLPAWSDFIAIITRVNDPITTPHNFTPGAVAYQLGVSYDVAAAIQWAASGLVVLAVVCCRAATVCRRVVPGGGGGDPGAVPDPVGPLRDAAAAPRGLAAGPGPAWAALIPLATCVALVGVIPPVVYPLAFGVTLVALLAERAPGEGPAPARGCGARMRIDGVNWYRVARDTLVVLGIVAAVFVWVAYTLGPLSQPVDVRYYWAAESCTPLSAPGAGREERLQLLACVRVRRVLGTPPPVRRLRRPYGAQSCSPPLCTSPAR